MIGLFFKLGILKYIFWDLGFDIVIDLFSEWDQPPEEMRPSGSLVIKVFILLVKGLQCLVACVFMCRTFSKSCMRPSQRETGPYKQLMSKKA